MRTKNLSEKHSTRVHGLSLYFSPACFTRGNCSIAGHSGFGMPSGEDAEWPIGLNADCYFSEISLGSHGWIDDCFPINLTVEVGVGILSRNAIWAGEAPRALRHTREMPSALPG